MRAKIAYLTRLSTLIEALPDAVAITDRCGKLLLVNHQMEVLFGYDCKELVGQLMELLMPEKFHRHLATDCGDYFAYPHIRHLTNGLELLGLKKDGREFPIEIEVRPLETEDGQVTLMTIRDLSVQKYREANLRDRAEHDSLTGLINRPLFEDRIAQAIVLSKRHKSYLAVLFIDIDDFKHVNDRYGHDVGDLILCAAAGCMKNAVREIDTVARIGGDEFALILLDIKSSHDALQVAKKILRCFNEGFLVADQKIKITVSIGIALHCVAFGDVDHQALLNLADSAMYDVKAHGKNNFKLLEAFDNSPS